MAAASLRQISVFSVQVSLALLETQVKCSLGFSEPGLVKSDMDTSYLLRPIFKKQAITSAYCLKKGHNFDRL